MKILYTSDIHASSTHLSSMFSVAEAEEVNCIVIGGDIVPHSLPDFEDAGPLKAQAKAIKADLAVLAVADEPDSAAINAKIDELLALKRTMMINKYEYVAAQRKLLTPEQRVSFDMTVIKRSKHGKKGKGHH